MLGGLDDGGTATVGLVGTLGIGTDPGALTTLGLDATHADGTGTRVEL
jgi:hypothetical protein